MANRVFFKVSKGGIPLKRGWLLFPILLFLISCLPLPLEGAAPDAPTENGLQGPDEAVQAPTDSKMRWMV